MIDRDDNNQTNANTRVGGNIEARGTEKKAGSDAEDAGPDRVGGNIESRGAEPKKDRSSAEPNAQPDRMRDGT